MALLLGASMAQAQHDPADHHEQAPPGDAQIVVTINPEVRIKARLGAPPPAPGPCGSTVAYQVKVINQGFVTAPLRAEIIGDGAPLATLHMDDEKLSGDAQDVRQLHLTLLGPGPADLTIRFSIEKNPGEHSGKDRVHLLVDCR